MDNDFEVHIEHKLFSRNNPRNVDWLDNFFTKNEFSKLWIKVFVMHDNYVRLLSNSPSKDGVRVLLDDTETRYSSSTPYKKLLRFLSCNAESFEKKYFPLRPGTLHNKYILFEKKSEDKIEMGYISGSYNFTKTANSKDNDIIFFSIKTKQKGYPGDIQGFNSPLEKAFITNFTNLLYDFTKSWQSINRYLICPNCSSTDIDDSMYCHEMTSKSGFIHLVPELSKGKFNECDSCVLWCNDDEFRGQVYLKDPDEKTHKLFSCGQCNAIFTEEGGLIGADMVPYISLDPEFPDNEKFDEDDELDEIEEESKRNIILNWNEYFDI